MNSVTPFVSFRKIGILLILIIIVFFAGIALYCHWKNSGIDDAEGYNSINAVISFFTLVFTIVASIFAYLAFDNTKKEFDKNKSDEEFNRAIDLLYRQLEYSKLNWSDARYLEYYNSLYVNLIVDRYELNKVILEDADSRIELNVLFRWLEEETKPYKSIILENDNLYKDRKQMLGKIFALNFSKNFETTIAKFIKLSDKFTKEESFLSLNNEGGREWRIRNLAIAKDIQKIINGGESEEISNG